MTRPLIALSVHPEHAWCIAHSDKRLENRDWAPPERVKGERIAIHATIRRPRPRHTTELRVELPEMPRDEDLVIGAIVATVRVVGHAEVFPDGQVELREAVPEVTDERAAALITIRGGYWAWGRFAWLLADVVTLPVPVPCKGMQGVWKVPADLAVAVSMQEQTARESGKR